MTKSNDKKIYAYMVSKESEVILEFSIIIFASLGLLLEQAQFLKFSPPNSH